MSGALLFWLMSPADLNRTILPVDVPTLTPLIAAAKPPPALTVPSVKLSASRKEILFPPAVACAANVFTVFVASNRITFPVSAIDPNASALIA